MPLNFIVTIFRVSVYAYDEFTSERFAGEWSKCYVLKVAYSLEINKEIRNVDKFDYFFYLYRFHWATFNYHVNNNLKIVVRSTKN